EVVEERDDGIAALHVVGERKGAGLGGGAHGVGRKRLLQPGAEDEAIHLIEDDLFVFKDRPPTEAVDIKALRSGKVSDTERHCGNLVLHRSYPIVAVEHRAPRLPSWDLALRASQNSRCGSDRANQTGPPFRRTEDSPPGHAVNR